MGMTGLASMYMLGNPVAYQTTGININQDDLPWWATLIMAWCARVKALQEANGKVGNAYRAAVKGILDKGNPHEIYKTYDSYEMAMEIESNKTS